MKRILQSLAVPAAIATVLLCGCNSDRITARTDPNQSSVSLVNQGYDTFGRKWESDNVTRSNSMLLTYTGTITDIDYATREVTLQGPQGQMETFFMDKKVRRFDEAKVGDKVSLNYYLGYNAEVRKPTAAEAQNPLVVVETLGKAGPEADPAGGFARRVRAVVTIEGMDRVAQTVTVKGPRGKYYVAHVVNPANFDKVKLGDTIVLTFTEAAAISLLPAENVKTN